MGRTLAYFDCRAGISGDMVLGALLSAGLPLSVLRQGLRLLPVDGYTLRKASVLRGGIRAVKLTVGVKPRAPRPRRFADVQRIISTSRLPRTVRGDALRIFRRLFQAEARVHGERVEAVHLHELGAVDCLVDIVGTVFGLHALGIEEVHASPLNTGSGVVATGHGTLPVPPPATAELLKNVPVYARGPARERTTPTGAAIITTLAESFGTMPEMNLRAVGTGAGTDAPEGFPNVLRLFVGTAPEFGTNDDIVVIETNIDDMDPRIYGHLAEILFSAGALDVFLTPIQTKKFRPGVRLTVLSPPERVEHLSEDILRETTTFGVRIYGAGRRILERESIRVETPYGRIRVKTGRLDGRIVTLTPEYDDARRAAARSGAPLHRIMAAARRAARAGKRKGGQAGKRET